MRLNIWRISSSNCKSSFKLHILEREKKNLSPATLFHEIVHQVGISDLKLNDRQGFLEAEIEKLIQHFHLASAH